MAAKKEKDASVTRITATTSKKSTSKKTATKTTASTRKSTAPKRKLRAPKAPRPLAAIGGYFKGAWTELRQVRWPNRKATWSLTGAVVAFTAFFVVLVLLLDALFKYIFELILG